MYSLQRQIIAAASAGAMLVSIVTPAAAETTLEITGNGADSYNNVVLKNSGDTNVVQSNTAVVTNTVSSNSSTGDNTVAKNTGGESTIMTGNASTQVKIQNMLNSNTAKVDCCTSNDLSVTLSANGSDSTNKAYVKDDKDVNVFQDNQSHVTNVVSTDSDTGNNKAYRNTNGDVLIVTGDVKTQVAVSTTANSNTAQVGGNHQEGSASVVVSGNGTNTYNSVKLSLGGDTNIVQANLANVANIVETKSETGHNKAMANTGGEVIIATGDAKTVVSVDNMVNFNWANVDCGCTTDLFAKIGQNGVDTKNKIMAVLDHGLNVFQGGQETGNQALLTNIIGGDSETGYNKVKSTTGDPGSDPSVLTGDSASVVEVENSGNVNTYGVGVASSWPEFEFDFSFNWAHLFHWLFI